MQAGGVCLVSSQSHFLYFQSCLFVEFWAPKHPLCSISLPPQKRIGCETDTSQFTRVQQHFHCHLLLPPPQHILNTTVLNIQNPSLFNVNRSLWSLTFYLPYPPLSNLQPEISQVELRYSWQVFSILGCLNQYSPHPRISIPHPSPHIPQQPLVAVTHLQRVFSGTVLSLSLSKSGEIPSPQPVSVFPKPGPPWGCREGVQLSFLGAVRAKGNNELGLCCGSRPGFAQWCWTFASLLFSRTLEFLMRHLARLADYCSITNMHTKNLAIVWAPNLLRYSGIFPFQ